MDRGVLFPESLAGFPVHLVGIKGTGMTALAEVLTARGARVTGSDTRETFYTDRILSSLGIPFKEGFSPSNVPPDALLIVHSAAYGREENPELAAAVNRGLPVVTYPEFLGLLSRRSDASGVSGVHGKSTTTALCGVILKAWGFPATVITGTEVPAFGGRAALVGGEKYLVAETCEYRRHFLEFSPLRIVVTSVEPDHLDYFKDAEDVLGAFVEYGRSLPAGGSLVYCADDKGASTVAQRLLRLREDLVFVPYGRSAGGEFRVTGLSAESGVTRFSLAATKGEFRLSVPGEHVALDAVAALALCLELWRKEKGGREPDIAAVQAAFASFYGTRRRSEIVGEASGVLFLDDYAHHPTAVAKTLAGLRAFYPGRRLVVDFMSHTYSRTKALLEDFGRCFSEADEVILHKIYASAREGGTVRLSGRDLFAEVSRHHAAVRYFEEPMEAAPFLRDELKAGDVFVTMGAGDNWRVGREVLRLMGGALRPA
jgi:UDP-N-acetylmuramate--alanine ligase